jgi:hypothetical protein
MLVVATEDLFGLFQRFFEYIVAVDRQLNIVDPPESNIVINHNLFLLWAAEVRLTTLRRLLRGLLAHLVRITLCLQLYVNVLSLETRTVAMHLIGGALVKDQ